MEDMGSSLTSGHRAGMLVPLYSPAGLPSWQRQCCNTEKVLLLERGREERGEEGVSQELTEEGAPGGASSCLPREGAPASATGSSKVGAGVGDRGWNPPIISQSALANL